ncbi:MAG: type IV secretion system DNA-binding domain-containing protein [Sporichthyaceae bacterium]|nr:type IV secretion system DNA-binding domain-containing protein [Sporichthyaceae bacterium]
MQIAARERYPQQVLAGRSWRRGFTVGVAELAALAHLPLDESIPGLSRARARPVPAPVELTGGGCHTRVLGHADTDGRAVTAPVDQWRHHTHLLGLTGCGKSTLLAHLVVDDAKAGRGAVVIDPKGDLVVDILDRLPAHLADKVSVYDPWQPYSPTFNVLEGPDHDLVVDNVVGIFRNIYSRHWGPRADDVLRSACLTLVRAGRTSLAIVPQLLNNPVYRAPLVADLPRDEADLWGFWSWYDSLTVALRSQVVGPVLSRIRTFTLRPFVRATVAWPISTLDMRKVLDGQILLARIPKGELGEDTSRLLGSFLVARIWQAATARARQGQHARVDTTLYLDEAHNFLTLPRALDEMLAEARGYRLSLVLAHQDLAQLPREIAAAISANARNKLYFTISPEDAHVLARHTAPELDETDLARLDAFTAAARLMHQGRHTPACTLRTRPPSPVLGHAQHIRAASAARFKALGSPEVTRVETRDVASELEPVADPLLGSEPGLRTERTSDPAHSRRPGRARPARRADSRGHP